jgi:hypothetical protein
MSEKKESVTELLSRGDELSLVAGRLIIKTNNGKEVSKSWLQKFEIELIQEIIDSLGLVAYQYLSYTTGFYGKHKSEGLTMQFVNTNDGSEAYAIFNVMLKRKRTTSHGKLGTLLPKGHFNLGVRHGFKKFFVLSTKKVNIRNASIHEHMGLLKPIFFTGNTNSQSKIINETLMPIEVSFEQIKTAYQDKFTGNSRVTHGQLTGNSRLSSTVNEYGQNHVFNDVQADLSTCQNNHELSLQGSRLIGNPLASNSSLDTSNNEHLEIGTQNQTFTRVMTGNKSLAPKRPQDQTTDEWLQDYDRAG